MRRARAMVVLIVLAPACAGTAAPPAVAFQTAPCPETIRRPDAVCGHLDVPEHRPSQGRSIALGVIRLGAAAPAQHAIFVLAGGPGQPSTALLPIADRWLRSARATHDLVFADQRGTGLSSELRCDLGVSAGPAEVFGRIFDPARVRRCRELLEARADLTAYTTSAAVDDLDDVRAALGYEQISLYGVSYGTRLAQAYLRRYPQRVRAVVLDGVLPDDVAIPSTYAATSQQAVDAVFAACEAESACRRAYPSLRDDFARVLASFDAGPRDTHVRDRGIVKTVRMSRHDFGYAIRGILYQSGAAARLPAAIRRAADTGDVQAFAQAYWDRAAALAAELSYGLHLSVICSEDMPRAGQRPNGATSTFLGDYLMTEYQRACDHWPRGPAPRDSGAVTAAVPVLLLSGEFDPSTPPDFGRRVAASLPRRHHLLARGMGHGVAPGCAATAVVQMLTAAHFDGLPAECW